MNKIYKVIWSKVKNQYVVVSELAHSNGKQSRTSRNSIRSRIAALVVCGAIAAFGVFSALPTSSAFAAGAEATAGQYIAIGGANSSDGHYDRNTRTYYKYYTGSDNKPHKYIFTQTKQGNFWVREGYTIDIVNNPRFGGDDAGNPDKEIIINTYKGEGADSNGLVQSYQNVQESMNINTLNGDKLFSTGTAMYGGAVNTSSTQVTTGEEYIINEGKTAVKSNNIGQYFHAATYNEKTGLYSYKGKVVSNENLYVISGQVGVFTTTANGNEVYTGDVYGRNNEILMTGVKENGDYVSYWGAEVVDPNATIGSMTVSTLQGKFDEVDSSIEKIHKDDIKQIQVASATNGGTIGLQTNGEFNEDGTAKGGANIPGTITVTSEGGTGGSGKANDVKIKFASENGGSFTVDAGSKVEGKTENGGNALTGLSINGQDYTIAAGGKSVTSSKVNDNGTITVYQGEDDQTGVTTENAIHDWNVTGGSFNKDGKLELTKENAYGGATDTVTIDGVASTNYVDAKDALNVKYDSTDKTSVTLGGSNSDPVKLTNVANGTSTYDAVNFSQLEAVKNAEDYVTSGTIDNTSGTITLKRVQGGDVTISGLESYVTGKDTYVTAATLSDDTLTITQNNQKDPIEVDLSGLTSGLSSSDYQVVANPDSSDGAYSVSADGTLKLTVKDLNNPNAEAKEVSISGIAQKGYVDAKDALNVKYDSTDKTSVTLGGSNSDPVKLTNVANGTSTYDAVNFSQLEAVKNAEDYVTSGTIDNTSGTITLKRVQGGDVTISGLESYVTGKDTYVTAATLSDDTLTITQNNQKDPIEVDLSGLTSGLSSSDYQLVAPESGSYTVDNNGNLTLTVKDLNNKNAAAKTIKISGLAKKTDVAVIHDQYKDGEYTNLRDTKAQIWDETAGASDKKSSSIALGKDAFVSVQNGRKGKAILFGSDTYTGGIAIGQDSKALNGTVNIGVKDYTGKMGDVIVGDPNNRDLDNGEYNTYTAMGVGETSIGSNSYISGSLSTNIGSYNITTTKYGNTSGILGSLYSAQNFGSVIVGTLNSIESNSSSAGMTSGVANSVIGMANKTQNSNGSLVFGTGNEITNSTASIPSPSSVSGDVADVAENFRDSVSDRNKSNGGAVLAIGGGNKADYAQNSQLIGVQNEVTGTSKDISEFNMVNGYQNTVTNGSNDTVIGTKNTVTNSDSNVVLGDNHAVQDANNNVILGSSDKETTHTASDTVVIGHNAQANSNNDVAIGSGSVANGAVGTAGYAGANPIGTVSVGSEGNERTITNVAAGRINEDSTDAVNGSQLYATNQNVTNLTTKVDAGWSLYSNGKEVKNVKPGNNLVNIDSGENVSITKNEDGNGITISADLKDLDVEDTNAVLYDNEGKTSVTLGGTGHEAVKLTNVAAGALTETSTDAVNGSQLFETNTKVDAGWSLYSNGKEVKNVKPGNNWISIDSGDNVSITKNEDGNGIKISADLKDLDVEDTNAVLYDDEGKTTVTLGGEGHEAVKLTNVAAGTVNATSTDAINGSQLYEVQQQAGKHTTVTVNGGMTAPEDGSYTHDEEGRLDGNLLLKKTDNNGQTEYDLKLNPDLTLQGEDDSTARVEIGGTNGTIMATKDPNSMTATTTIDGGNVYVGSSVSVGDKVVMTDKDITGLSNTTWDGTTDDASRAATEGQLQAVSNEAGKHTTVTVNGGMTAPEDGSYTHDEEGRLDGNLLLKKTDNNGQTEYDLKLNPDLTLQGEDGSTARVEIGGTNGTIMATKDPNSMTATTTIDGGNVYVGSSVSVGDKVVMTDKDITGLSNTTWDGTTDDASRAATEGQLQAVSNEAGKHTTVTVNGGMTAPEDGSYTHDEEGRLDGNLLLKKTDNNGQTEYDLKLNPDLTLQGEDGSTARVEIGGTNGTIMATKDPNSMTATTTIDGGNVYVGSSVSVGDKVVMTDKDITGLSNTTWDGTTDNASRAATEGQLKTVSDNVNAGWIATDNNGNEITVNPTDNTLNFSGDRNVTVEANKEDGSIDVSLNDDIVLGGKDGSTSRVEIGGTNGTIMATKDANDMAATTTIDGGNVYVGSSISVGDKVEITDKDITGLSNTSWNGTTDDESRAATEGQLKDVSDTVNAGWTATDSNGASIVVNPENGSTLNFAGDRNIEVKANEKDGSIDVSLDDDMVLGGKEGTSRVEIGGTNGTIMATKDPNSMAATTTIDGGNVYVGSSISVGDKVEITDKDITGLSNTEWNGTTTTPDRAATEGQLQQVSNDVNAGWIATDNNGSQVNITPDNNKLNFAGDENVTVTAANNEIKVALKDDIVLGDYLNGDDGVLIGGSSGTISATNSITVGEDQGLIIDGQKKEIQGLSNTTWNEKIANDAAVEGSTAASTAATQGQLQEVSKVANAGWTASDGTNSISVKPNETLNFVGDENLTVSADGTDKELKVSLNDDITLKGDSSSIELTGTKGTIQVNQETAEGTNFTNINGNVVSIGYTNSEGIENAIVIDGGKGTITGLSNTTWDDELAKQVANSEELQGTAATQGQLQQAVSAVATEAAKQHTTVSGDDNLTVKSSVNENGGTNYQVTLDDDITLGNPKAGNTEGERSFTINTTAPEGYVPDSYKEEGSSGAEFIKENGGFMLFATDTQGHGIFGVTAKGSAWAKDFKTYTTDIYGNNTQYSLNDVGDAVAQMSSYYNKENGKSYTVFSRYLNEAEKDNPFATVDENATRDIPLALRDDGAVLIGATIKGDDFTDNGIRINAETETTYDGDGNEVTNNIATITGLENTEWKPPTPVATFAANDINTTSRAATEAQLDDLYSAVAAYDVNVDGTIDYSHIALAGTPYGASRSGNGTHTGGTSITNVAYASGKDGSEAVNVDYLNDAISDAAENGSISTSDQHLVANTETGSNGVYKPNDDGNVNLIVSDEKGNSSTITIGDVASKEDLDNLKDDVGDLDYSKVEGDTIIDGDSVTDAIGKLDNKIDNITGTATDADNNTVTGGKINSDGTISLTQKDKDSIKLEGQLTDSGVVQEGTSFDKETGTITITSQDKYSGETSSVKVEGIASTEVVGATNKEDLATAYKDADKDGNATTEYITDSESMVEADVALDHAIQDVAGTSYANDMVLSNRIDSVEKRLGNVEERIDKVGAMAAAIANLRTMGFDPEAPTEIAIGVGQYKSETGIAIGVFHYPNQDFMLSASLSSSGDELMGGIGATWKLGRKSAAERVKDEEARHLEQAEEMKKLAQQEKVKAQAQRHAKLLAERQQASQKNA